MNLNTLFEVEHIATGAIFKVFGIKSNGHTSFLIYNMGWLWVNAVDYKPLGAY